MYDRIQQSIEYLKEKHITKTTEAKTQRTLYDNHPTTASPESMPQSYKNVGTKYLVAQHIFQHYANHIYDEAVKHQIVDTLINGEQKDL